MEKTFKTPTLLLQKPEAESFFSVIHHSWIFSLEQIKQEAAASKPNVLARLLR